MIIKKYVYNKLKNNKTLFIINDVVISFTYFFKIKFSLNLIQNFLLSLLK